jgi:hypothetical protein
VREREKKEKALLAHFIFYVVVVHAMVAHGERNTPECQQQKGRKTWQKSLLWNFKSGWCECLQSFEVHYV